MSTATSPEFTPASGARPAGNGRGVRLLAMLVILAGLVMAVAGGVTWAMVQSQLADENITVAEDSDWFAGEPVDGPLTAYAQAAVIEKHALAASDGLTYAELDRDDPRRETVMNGSFLRASLFTSVLAFGVAAMAMGLGVLVVLIGWCLLSLARRLGATGAMESGGTGSASPTPAM